ncbi:peptidoglycan editing factor PgeF [Scytonema millei]|uniref:Purine nucleoside phosphorylase n=1 Tax=Scytonema millei VB511283 TaxID=1245923 RepID=A0A9X5E5W1_9CYAN|nr:peptidoglycan editing factor PgeF [Scytonema millei]NHC35846.1 peptidoglycan editing factor PgeF [Scytonema millei VB511283]
MHTWDWRGCEGFLYLSCSLLEAFPHGFFTRHFHPHAPHDLTSALHPEAEAYRVKQVHGNVVVTPSEVRSVDATAASRRVERGARSEGAEGVGEVGEAGGEKPRTTQLPATNYQLPIQNSLSLLTPNSSLLVEADGLLTEQPLQAVWVASADCTPVLIADRHTGQVAAVHAGWRGTAMKIVPQAIARLQAQGSKIQDLRVALGPAIAGSVYQVSQQVAAEVGASITATETKTEILDFLAEIPNSPLFPDSHPERVRLDIRRVITLQLEQLGISPEQVAIAPHCTYQEPERFFSYRRDKQKKVQWSGIISQ